MTVRSHMIDWRPRPAVRLRASQSMRTELSSCLAASCQSGNTHMEVRALAQSRNQRDGAGSLTHVCVVWVLCLSTARELACRAGTSDPDTLTGPTANRGNLMALSVLRTIRTQFSCAANCEFVQQFQSCSRTTFRYWTET